MNMRQSLYKALADGVLDVGGRVYALTTPQDTNHKCLVYKFIGYQEMTGITCIEPINTRFMVQIDCLAPTYGESVDLAEEVRRVLRANFLCFNFYGYEDYLNITLKYRQIVDVQLELKPIYASIPVVVKDCALSVGALTGKDFNLTGFWYRDCSIFKG